MALSVFELLEHEFTSANYSGWEDQVSAQRERECARQERAACLRAVDLYCFHETRKGSIGNLNASLNLSGMREGWSTGDIRAWLAKHGLEPIYEELIQYGPYFPPIKPSLAREGYRDSDVSRGSQSANGTEGHYLYSGDEGCPHIFVVSKIGGGIECNFCPGWFCY